MQASDNHPPRALERIGRFRVAGFELFSGKRGKRQGLAQFLTVIPRDAEQVHHVPVEVVIDLGVAAGFPEQDGGCAAEGLDVSVMWRQVLDDPGSKFPLASVVAQDWATNPFHDVLSCSALRRLSWSRS